MIQEKKVLGIIPARGGSKGIPRKNIRQVAGKPLIAWTIEGAQKSRYIDRLILSSEDAEIIQVARKWGCDVPFVRPAEISRDDTSGIDPVLHALWELPGYDYVVLLQPTSPLRTAEDIDGCIETCIHGDYPVCVSVTEPDKSPYWMFTLDDRGRLRSFLQATEVATRRQDLPPVYALNGAVYVSECGWLENHNTFFAPETGAYPMPRERSLDIDTEFDLRLFEAVVNLRASGE